MNNGKELIRQAGIGILSILLKHATPYGLAADIYEVVSRLKEAQQKIKLEERVSQLEQAAECKSPVCEKIADQLIREKRAEGSVISQEIENSVKGLVTAIPHCIKARTRATILFSRGRNRPLTRIFPVVGSGLPEHAQNDFYSSIIPVAPPQFAVGEVVPGTDGWCFNELIALGGFGEIWKATKNQSQLAFKFSLKNTDFDILDRERRTLHKIQEKLPDHPNIIQLIDSNFDVNPPWLAFEFFEKGTLESWIDGGGSRSWDEVSEMFDGILQGIAALHSIEVVHRDLKPANIFLSDFGEPKIADLGLGKVLPNNQDQIRGSQLTMRGFGTPFYMSSAQQSGKPAHSADDTFALGVILFQMLFGCTQEDPQYASHKLNKMRPPPPHGVSKVILGCLNNPREERPQTAQNMLSLLTDLMPPRHVGDSSSDMRSDTDRSVLARGVLKSHTVSSNSAPDRRDPSSDENDRLSLPNARPKDTFRWRWALNDLTQYLSLAEVIPYLPCLIPPIIPVLFLSNFATDELLAYVASSLILSFELTIAMKFWSSPLKNIGGESGCLFFISLSLAIDFIMAIYFIANSPIHSMLHFVGVKEAMANSAVAYTGFLLVTVLTRTCAILISKRNKTTV